MRTIFLLIMFMIAALGSVWSATVVYDLSVEPGVFNVQVNQTIQSPLPMYARFQASSSQTIVDEEYAYDSNGEAELPVEVLQAERSLVRASLAGSVVEESAAEIVMGALFDDWESLQYDGERLMFSRETNIRHIRIVLPPDYAVIFVDYPSTVEYEDDGRVVLTLENHKRELLGVTVVAHRFWGRSLIGRSGDGVISRK